MYSLTPIDTVLSRPIELALPIPDGKNVSVFVTANGESRVLPGKTAGSTVRLLSTASISTHPARSLRRHRPSRE